MGFIMHGLHAEAYDRVYRDRQLIKRIIGCFHTKWRVMAIIAPLIISNTLLDAVSPILISRGIDTLLLSGTFQVVLILVGLILLSGGCSWVLNLFRQWLTARAVGDVVLQLRLNAFDAVMSHDMSFFEEYSRGKIVSRVISDTEDFATVVTLTFNLLNQSLLFLLIMGVLFFRNWQLALLTLAVMPFIVVAALAFRRLARLSTQHAQRSRARVNANVQEAMSGITVAKNFRQERTMYDEFKQVNEQFYQVNLRAGYLYNGIFPVLLALANIGTTVVVYFGGQSVFNHSISAGDWFLFVQSLGLLWLPLTSIASFWSQFQLGLGASERVFALLDAEARVRQIDCQAVPQLTGLIEFQHLFFSYDDRQTVFADFNLTIRAGETVALVGHTGAGKSSLGKLVARFYEFQGGLLLIDGCDIRTFDLHDYRRHLGIVPQTPFLFSGTIAENICYAKPGASDAEIAGAAERIGGGDWLEALPEGLQTPVGEEGKALSMGQRQLVTLARTLLQNPSIVILDEATASVDPLTEAQIQEGLDTVLKDRTAIIIAHRLSTIRHADRVIVLNQGRIIEEGNHEALIRRQGHYAQLYNTYFRHQSPDYRPRNVAK